MIMRKISKIFLMLAMIVLGTSVAFADALGKAQVTVTYNVLGKGGNGGGTECAFTLQGVTKDTPMPEGGNPAQISVKANGKNKFGRITYNRPGVYVYQVSRRGTPEGASHVDRSVYRVTIVVQSDGKVQQVLEKDGEKVTEIRYEDKWKNGNPVTELIQTGDMKNLKVPALGVLAAGLLLAILRKIRRTEKNSGGSSGGKIHRVGMLLAVMGLTGMLTAGGTLPTYGATKDITVKYDQFDALPENYAKITNLRLGDAEITTTNENFGKYNGYVGNNQDSKRDFIAYYGNVSYGTANRTSKVNASTKANSISGTITLRWSKGATLSDNTKADVRIQVSGITFSLGKKDNTKLSASTKVYIPILQASTPTSRSTELCASSPRTNYGTNKGTTSTSLSGACIKTKCNVKVQILQAGTDTPVDSTKYPRILTGFRDLDQPDPTIATGKSMAAQYDGEYAEGVELLSGFESPVVLAKKSDSNPAMQTLEKVVIVNDNLRIRGDGARIEAYNKATGTSRGDNATFYSGCIVPVKAQGYSFKWTGGAAATTGSMLGTALWSPPEVAVLATAGEGGQIEKTGTTTYIINSSTTYDYTPKPGYRVKSLTVEGKSVDFNPNGGTYRFARLYDQPVHPRSATKETTYKAKVYTIDVQFERIQHQITTSVVNGTIDPDVSVGEGDDETIHYEPDEGYELDKITVDGEEVNPKDFPQDYPFKDVREDHHIEVVYRKIPVGDLTLSKKVTGALGDRSKEFEFEIKLKGLKPEKSYAKEGNSSSADAASKITSDENGNANLKVTLKGGDTVVIRDIPAGATYQIVESASDHIASFYQKGSGENPKYAAQKKENADPNQALSMEEEMLDPEDGNMEITWTNYRPIATVTGVGDDDTSYVMAGIAVLIVAGGWIFRVILYRRKL